MSWHDRPVFAPCVYLLSTFVVGSMTYFDAYVLMGSIRISLGAVLFVDGLLMLYLRESHRVARRKESDRASEVHPAE